MMKGNDLIRMRKHELEEIFFINKEISLWENELNELRNKSLVGSPKITDVPKGSLKYMLDDYATDIVECEQQIKSLLLRAQKARRRTMKYIKSISDSRIRQIVYLRTIKGLKWMDIAGRIGGCTPDSVRMEYSRFLKKEAVK